jgi:hypothetical protein
MKDALASTMTTLPEQLRRSLTWDRGKELSAHAAFKVETASPSTSLTRKARGSAARTRTPTGCCVNTSRRAPTCRAGPPRRSKPSLPRSTTDHARHSAGKPPPRPSTNTYARCNKAVLRPPIEPGQIHVDSLLEPAPRRASGRVDRQHRRQLRQRAPQKRHWFVQDRMRPTRRTLARRRRPRTRDVELSALVQRNTTALEHRPRFPTRVRGRLLPSQPRPSAAAVGRTQPPLHLERFSLKVFQLGVCQRLKSACAGHHQLGYPQINGRGSTRRICGS